MGHRFLFNTGTLRTCGLRMRVLNPIPIIILHLGTGKGIGEKHQGKKTWKSRKRENSGYCQGVLRCFSGNFGVFSGCFSLPPVRVSPWTLPSTHWSRGFHPVAGLPETARYLGYIPRQFCTMVSWYGSWKPKLGKRKSSPKFFWPKFLETT